MIFKHFINRNPKFAKSGNFRDLTVSSPKVQGPNCNFAVPVAGKVGDGRRTHLRHLPTTITSRIKLHNTRNLYLQSKFINNPRLGRNLIKKLAGFRRVRLKLQNTTPFSTDLVDS